MHFSWIDLIVILVVIRGALIGYRRGFSGEALRFLGVFFALFLASKFYETGSDRLIEQFDIDRRAAIAISFAVISLAVIIFFYMINRMVRHLMQLPLVAALEKGGGAVFGGLKALLLAFAVLILLALVKVEAVSDAVSNYSYFGSLAVAAVPGVYKFVVRVYPGAQSERAEDVIHKLPAVKQRTELDFYGEEKKGEEEEDQYIKP